MKKYYSLKQFVQYDGVRILGGRLLDAPLGAE